MAKELAMIENNEIGKTIRRYFIEVEKRYRTIVETPQNIFDFMRLAIDQIEANTKEIQNVKRLSENNLKEIEKIQSQIDVKIKKEYCLASDITEHLQLYSENGLPHANLIGAIAIIYQRNAKNGIKGEIREKGFKIEKICYKVDIHERKVD